MAAVAELHRLSGLVMRSVIDHLWPKEPSPDSYFGLVQQFLGAMPRIDAMRRSACIEGARMALARVKAYWMDIDATIIASQDSVGGPISSRALLGAGHRGCPPDGGAVPEESPIRVMIQIIVKTMLILMIRLYL